MRLLFIRHGETVDNVANLYAGVRDSALTTHGVLQANRLGAYLAKTYVKISHIFSSDLKRAAVTAEAIRSAQSVTPPETTQLTILREQDFGFYEGKPYSELRGIAQNGNTPGFKEVESKPAMQARMESFIDLHLAPLFAEPSPYHTVVVVAHGIILSHLWRCVLNRFHPHDVVVSPSAIIVDQGLGLQHIGRWSNTGVLDLEIKLKAVEASTDTETEVITEPAAQAVTDGSSPAQPTLVAPTPAPASTSFLGLSLCVKAINNQDHLKGLKKTRGGIGSLKHDSSQKTMDSFVNKKPRVE